MVETIDSQKIAENVSANNIKVMHINPQFQLNIAWDKNRENDDENLKILIQVNTSREENKHGIEPEKVKELYEFITEKCPALELKGKNLIELMQILIKKKTFQVL